MTGDEYFPGVVSSKVAVTDSSEGLECPVHGSAPTDEWRGVYDSCLEHPSIALKTVLPSTGVEEAGEHMHHLHGCTSDEEDSQEGSFHVQEVSKLTQLLEIFVKFNQLDHSEYS